MNVEIFGSSGGLAEGFRRAGITFDLVIDHDPDACASYEDNLDHRPVQMDVRDLVRMVRGGWRPTGGVDLLVADPPCTPWSRAGKRKGVADERDCLAEVSELIALLRPRCYLVGNIPGLEDAPNLRVVQRVIGGLARHGYCVTDYARLDAVDLGVPQFRTRPYWFGHLDGPCIRWPAPTHGDPACLASATLRGMTPLRPWVTCREALLDLQPEDLGRPVRMKLRPNRKRTSDHCRAGSDVTRCSKADRPAATVVSHASSKGGQILIAPEGHRPNRPEVRNVGPQVLMVEPHHPPSRLDEPAMTIRAGSGGGANRALALDGDGDPRRGRTRGDRAPRVPQDERATSPETPSPTIAWPWDRPSTTSGPNAIVLSERAAAILQGFPPGWRFCGATKRARWSQIGQAVPPAVAEAIARAIGEQRAAARKAAGATLDTGGRR